jgi:hypothetical protein
MRFPTHAYIPGQTARHDPETFSGLHASVEAGMTVEALQETAAWKAGLAFLHNGYFWEAHEALEPVWMQTPPNSPERHLVQAVIQIANASLKELMGKPNAVCRLCDIAESHISDCGDIRTTLMGLHLSDLLGMIRALRNRKNRSISP